MRLDDFKPSDNVEDQRGRGGMGGGFGFPRGGGGGGFNLPMGGRGGFSLRTLIILAVIYFALKFIFGIDLMQVLNGGGVTQNPGGGGNTEITLPDGQTDVAAGKTPTVPTQSVPTQTDGTTDEAVFVSKVLTTTEVVWDDIFKNMGKTYVKPKLVLFNGFVQSSCGTAQSAMGPFYCPGDQKVYIDLSFYRDMERKLGSPGDFAKAYVIAHEVGHHVQTLLGISDKVTEARARASETESNALSVRMELQADCLAGIWAKHIDEFGKVLQEGDIEEGLNAASQIGDDRMQKRAQGYVVPESFTHGTSEQRVRWFKNGFGASSLKACDTFNTDQV